MVAAGTGLPCAALQAEVRPTAHASMFAARLMHTDYT
jgi:hypothetical protein